MKEKFLNFIDPFLSYIDKGELFRKPFSWLYIAFAVLNAIAPFYLLYLAIDSGILNFGAKFVFAFLLLWLFILAACWVGVQIWWNRKDKVLHSSKESSDFPATPVIAHLIQTSGEWIGSFIAIVGIGVSLVALFFGNDAAGLISDSFNLPLNLGIAGVILSPIYGFLIIICARFTAEMCRALAVIANNTKK
jgi:hypothetical protein